MPAGQSIIGIYNIALAELGEDPAISLNDGTKAVNWCNARYNDARQTIIRRHPWNCTKKMAQLAASITAPPFKYANAYPLPADYIRFFDLPDNDEAAWEIFSGFVYTDETAPLNSIYHFDLTDVTVFDPLMARCIGYDLAIEIGPSIIRDDAKMKRIADKLESRITMAMLVDSQEDSPKEWDEDILLRSRR